MYSHANAKLGLAGRLALVRAIEEGQSLKAAVAAFDEPAVAKQGGVWSRNLRGVFARLLNLSRLQPRSRSFPR
jgi:hypothetical protein